MCFSATASLVASGGLASIGVASLFQVCKKTQILYASVPLLFSAHQLIEGLLWLCASGTCWVNNTSTLVYVWLFIAAALWPTVIPLALYFIEPQFVRKRILSLFSVLGVLVSFVFIWDILSADYVGFKIEKHSIKYIYPRQYVWLTETAYLAVLYAGFISSYKIPKIFAILTIISNVVVTYLFIDTYYSVWCFVGALLSSLIFIHIYCVRRAQLSSNL